MVLVRLFIPLLLVCFLTYIIVTQLNTDKKGKDEKLHKAEDEGLEHYVQDLKLKIAQSEAKMRGGLESAEADLTYYKQQLDKVTNIKEKSKVLG